MPDPIEFENLVAAHFEDNGYKVKKTPRNYDFGVDLFAIGNNEKIAIQVKMYKSRKVNHEAVTVLFAAQKYFDCQSSILVTSGELTKQAQEVAEKLGVSVWAKWYPKSMDKTRSNIAPADFFFKYLWKNHIMSLSGSVLEGRNGRKNKIIEVNWDFVKRITSNGKKQKIQVEIFRKVINHLVEHGEIERSKINELYVKRASSGITLILAQNPYIKLMEKPKMKLILNKQLYIDLLRKKGFNA